MLWRSGGTLTTRLMALDRELASIHLPEGSSVPAAIARWRADAAALEFHLNDRGLPPRITVIIGGTGTGKSTLVNRLLNANLTASSFRRTFTAGPVAVTWDENSLPEDWLAVQHTVAAEDQRPAKGELDHVIVVPAQQELLKQITLVDTPDLDGDQPAHHAQADRAFRWAQALLFLVTPEKYQMTELLPYYRLARRYSVPALFVMNKAEEAEVVDDYADRLIDHLEHRGPEPVPVFAIPRDDAAFEPTNERNLSALHAALIAIPKSNVDAIRAGLGNRAADLLDRLQDQILAPLDDARRAADRLIAALRAMETPTATIDVNPLTRQLQRRLQQRSILYLIGPGRILDRVRQVPGLLARLPRTAWDLIAKGRVDPNELEPNPAINRGEVPDFRANVVDQFVLVQSRIEDVIRSDPAGQRWIDEAAGEWTEVKLSPEAAGAIADQELDDLRGWLEKKWNATPRDTALMRKLLKHLPGAEKLTRWSEAAPYVLTIVVATHHAFFGHIDLMIIGGYSLATWLSERMSNEVALRARLTNKRLAEGFERLTHEQIERVIAWIALRAPASTVIQRIRTLGNELSGATL